MRRLGLRHGLPALLTLALLTLALLTLGLASLGQAQVPDPQDPDPDAGLGQSVVTDQADGSKRVELTLRDAIEQALVNNLDIEVQRFDPLIRGEQEIESWGAYDPEWFMEFGYSSIKNPNSFSLNQVAASLDKSTDGLGGFRGLIPFFGSQYNFQYEGAKTGTNSSIQSLSPQFTSGFSLSFTQPLMRGLIWNQPWTRVKTSRVIYDQSLEDFRRQVMDTIELTEDAYWNVIATEEQKGVAEKSLETAQALLEQTNTQYEVGVVSKVEVVESEAGVADREFNLIVAENLYEEAQDFLLNTLLGTGFAADSKILVVPTDRPQDYVTYEVDAEAASARAFEKRPELAIADDEIERRTLELKFAKNDRLPQFDVNLTYGNRGLAGRQNGNLNPAFAPPTPITPTDFGDTIDDFLTDDAADQFSVRALFSVPLPNTAARSRVSQQKLDLLRARSQKRRLEQLIILEIRNAVRDLESAQEGIEAAKRASAAAAEQLRAERIRLEYGESTPFDVLLREEDFAEAESREIGAFQLYRSSVTGLNRAQGTILQTHNIAIDAVSPLR